MSKTNKSVSKRFRVTPKGKVLFRRGPKNHYRAKKSGTRTQKIGDINQLDKTFSQTLKERYLQNS